MLLQFSCNILCTHTPHYRITYTFTSPEHIWCGLFLECLLPWGVWKNLCRILKGLSCPSLKRRRWDMSESSPNYSAKEIKDLLFRETLFQHTEKYSDFVFKCQQSVNFFVKFRWYKKLWKRTQFKEKSAVQLFVLHMLFFRNQYLVPLERKKKDWLHLMEGKYHDVFCMKLQHLLSS